MQGVRHRWLIFLCSSPPCWDPWRAAMNLCHNILGQDRRLRKLDNVRKKWKRNEENLLKICSWVLSFESCPFEERRLNWVTRGIAAWRKSWKSIIVPQHELNQSSHCLDLPTSRRYIYIYIIIYINVHSISYPPGRCSGSRPILASPVANGLLVAWQELGDGVWYSMLFRYPPGYLFDPICLLYLPWLCIWSAR